ncbi:glutamic acid-rich protein-like [Ruditapes philippinarum]|uniref:glutamic acid-rich protein-like n=1 Tax=Ruditapes philippinarum TaxID=129788 RepID=UPI00295B0D4D|nr:glutamic acid-rich protein-like [Ruditapes philippinarum]
MLKEKQEKKELEEREKQKRKEERLRKKIQREEQMKLKKKIRFERQRALMQKRKQKAHASLKNQLESDSDDAVEIKSGICYTCESQYTEEFIECEKCQRRFHIVCVQNEMIDGVPFECKFC